MMGIISTGITEGKGRAGVMIPIPGYSMYQARLLQHNTHQVIPIRVLGVASRVACSRRSDSRVRCLGEIVRGGNEGRVGRERGNSPSLVSPIFFLPVFWPRSIIWTPGTAGYFPREVTLVLRRIFRSCFHYRSRIFLYLTYVAGGFVWEEQRKGVRGEWSACKRFARAIVALLRFNFHACWPV